MMYKSENFNPRSHEGSDSISALYSPFFSISIHAPTKGATDEQIATLQKQKISIHAPTKGATLQRRTTPGEDWISNPRSHEGSYVLVFCHVVRQLCISIHAPTKGATKAVWDVFIYKKNFNPRSHEGSDRFCGIENLCVTDFNPRSHEGSDFRAFANSTTLLYFNPRSHEGSDGFGRS